VIDRLFVTWIIGLALLIGLTWLITSHGSSPDLALLPHRQELAHALEHLVLVSAIEIELSSGVMAHQNPKGGTKR
jgi:hypothetical protein